MTLSEQYEDFLYSHIEWEHIELDANTDDLTTLSFERLERLALQFGF